MSESFESFLNEFTWDYLNYLFVYVYSIKEFKFFQIIKPQPIKLFTKISFKNPYIIPLEGEYFMIMKNDSTIFKKFKIIQDPIEHFIVPRYNYLTLFKIFSR